MAQHEISFTCYRAKIDAQSMHLIRRQIGILARHGGQRSSLTAMVALRNRAVPLKLAEAVWRLSYFA